MKNLQAKTRPVDDPYEVWVGRLNMGYGDILNVEWRILKKWTADDYAPNARWYTAAMSEATHGNWEYGDMMAADIRAMATRIK